MFSNKIGEINFNNQGLKMWIKAYRKYADIDVEFEDGYVAKNKHYNSFKKGNIKNPNFKNSVLKNRIGDINYNNQGLKMEIINYENCEDIDVIFENGYTSKNNTYRNFKTGEIKNLYFPEICGVGYIGEGKYKSIINKNKTNEYKVWVGMLQRCYDSKCKEKHPSYIGCSVCDEWHNFQNFAKWCEDNYYEISGERTELDKDILVKNNKVYSPENCIFVPKTINSLLIKCDRNRGMFPIGVTFEKDTNKFLATCSINKKRKKLGRFDTEIEAFNTYKKEKEKEIKRIADEYKNKIPEKLYNALYSYEVEIDD